MGIFSKNEDKKKSGSQSAFAPKRSLFTLKQDKKRVQMKGMLFVVTDIGSKTTRILVGTYKDNFIQVETFASQKNSEIVSFNGKISNVNAVGATVRKLIKDNNISVKDVISSIESTEIIKRELLIPEVPDGDALGLITYEIGQYLTIDVSSYVIQYKKTGSAEVDGATKTKVMVAAMPRSITDMYSKVFEISSLVPFKMDVNSNSIEKLIKFDVKNNSNSPFKDKNVVFIDMGHSFFNISVYTNTEYSFNRIIEIGGSMIDNLISEQLRIEPNEAEKIKLDLSSRISIMDLSTKFVDRKSAALSATGTQKILLELMNVVDRWIFEVDSVFRYYTTRDRSNTIDEIYIYGGCSYFKDIDSYFESKLSIKTTKITDFGSVKCKNQIIAKKIPNFINVLGALIEN